MQPLHPITIIAIVVTLIAITAVILLSYSVMRSQRKNPNYKRGKTVGSFQYFLAAVGMVIFTFLIHNYDVIYKHDYKIVFSVLALTAIRTAIRYYKDQPAFKEKQYTALQIDEIKKSLLDLDISDKMKNQITNQINDVK